MLFRPGRLFSILLGISILITFIHGCARGPQTPLEPAVSADKGGAGQSSSLPPLVVDEDAPLLLDGPAGGGTPAGADNSTCFVCHANYSEEPLAVGHAAQRIGCVRCHGESLAHKNDENNTTPPDVMFPSKKIDAACGECHKSHDAPAVKVLARRQERCPEKTDPRTIVCTDCHGNHRLKLRSVRWDKETGKLRRGKGRTKDAE